MPHHARLRAGLFLACCCLLLTTFALQAHADTDKPNIILIYADDISARELPIYGSDTWSKPTNGDTQDPAFLAKTPVLNRIAQEGMWFQTAWAATVCSPSRAMIMTGRYAHLHKWWHNNDYGTYPNNKPWKGPPVPLYDTSPILIGHAAQQGGYATYWSGKTQMKGSDLTKFGFDEACFTPGEQNAPKSPYTTFALDHIDGDRKKPLVNRDTGEPLNHKSYAQQGWYFAPHVRLLNAPNTTDALTWWPNTPESIEAFGPHTYGPDVELNFIFEFMERQSKNDKPFFIYHTSHLGHDGFDWLNPSSTNKWPGTPKITWNKATQSYTRTEPKITGSKGVYDTHGTVTEPGIHTHIEYLDYQVDLYIKKLQNLGLLDNTILIFCADNGTSGYGKASEDRQKGTHVPLIIYAPGLNLTKQGEQSALVSMADFLPTIAQLSGFELPVDYEVNGKSLIPFLFTDTDDHRDYLYAYKQQMQLARGHQVMRDGRGKWWDVSKQPSNLIDFPEITDWSKVSQSHRDERDMLITAMQPFNKYETEHDPVR